MLIIIIIVFGLVHVYCVHLMPLSVTYLRMSHQAGYSNLSPIPHRMKGKQSHVYLQSTAL